MNQIQTVRQSCLPRWAACLAATALLATTACVTTPPSAEGFAEVPLGSALTYHRKSSGSLGAFDGPVVWTYSTMSWAGSPVHAFGAPLAGISLHRPGDAARFADLDPTGKPLAIYDPPIGYQWPLSVGKQWTSTHLVTLPAAGRTVSMTIQWKVESWGDVTVPAGTFKAFKLVWSNNLGEVETRWASPQEGLMTIKRHVERPASHPQGLDVLDAELLKRAVAPR